MADEWACDDCGYITSAEPDAGKCPGCGSKMTKIEGVDDVAKGGDDYDDDALATPIDDDDDMLWDDVGNPEAEDESPKSRAAAA